LLFICQDISNLWICNNAKKLGWWKISFLLLLNERSKKPIWSIIFRCIWSVKQQVTKCYLWLEMIKALTKTVILLDICVTYFWSNNRTLKEGFFPEIYVWWFDQIFKTFLKIVPNHNLKWRSNFCCFCGQKI